MSTLYEAPGGDDVVAQVTEDDSATIFDGRTGQTLAFDSYNDGEQRHQVIAQFEDLRVSWSVPADGFPTRPTTTPSSARASQPCRSSRTRPAHER